MTSKNDISRWTLLVILPAALLVGCAFCSVGISSSKPLDQILLTSGLSSLDLKETDLTKLCQRVGVDGRGRKGCGRSAEVAGVLAEAAWVGVTHCQHLMKYDRWNCSLGHSRLKIMKKAFRETAFLQSMSAAAVAHVVSRACAAGRLSRCSCDDYSAAHIENLKVWRWGGCGDNLKYGAKFTRQIFTDGSKKTNKKGNNARIKQSVFSANMLKPLPSRDLKAHIDAHNAQVGVQVVESSIGQSCKCHGVSGSCAMKTCWNQLPSFITSADVIKSLYETAFLISTSNEAQLLPKPQRKKRQRQTKPSRDIRRGQLDQSEIQLYNKDIDVIARLNKTKLNVTHSQFSRKSPRVIKKRISGSFAWESNQLVYLDRSPNFCKRSKYSPGTQERRCDKGSNCETLCCGRGYDTSIAELLEPCKCSVEWCCKVQCQNCTRSTEMYTCK